MASIYALTDPKTGEVRYIGKANDPEARLKSHMRDSRRRDTPVYQWIRKHGRPGMVVLASDCDDWRVEEIRLIAEARARGDRLLNIADGGDEPFCRPEVRAENGAKVAKKRSKHLWAAHRKLGQHKKYFERIGNSAKVKQMETTIAMLRKLQSDAIATGTLHLLEARLEQSSLGHDNA